MAAVAGIVGPVGAGVGAASTPVANGPAARAAASARPAKPGIFAAASLILAGTASAAALSGSSADSTITELRAEGYNVQLNLNGTRDVPLSECTVTGVEGLPNTAPMGGAPTAQFTTVYVDVDCPPGN